MLIDDTIGSLDDESLERVSDIFNQELRQTTVINIGKAAEARDPFFSRVLHLVKSPATSLGARSGPQAQDATAPTASAPGST